MDPVVFLARFPEFGSATEGMVDAVLAEATRRTDTAVWGTKTDDGIAYLAAHLLAISPFGQQARLVAKDGSTTYGVERDRMKYEVAGGYRVV